MGKCYGAVEKMSEGSVVAIAKLAQVWSSRVY